MGWRCPKAKSPEVFQRHDYDSGNLFRNRNWEKDRENGRIPFPGKYFLLLILKFSAFVFRREVYLMEEMGVFSEKN